MVLEGGQPVQAFPLTPTTFVGVASDFDMEGYTILHANEDGSLTLDFPNKTISVSVTAGMDFAIDPQCTKLSSTGEVVIS